MVNGDENQDPLEATLDSVRNTGTSSGLTGGSNRGEPGHDGDHGEATDLGEIHYSPEMGSIVIHRHDSQQDAD